MAGFRGRTRGELKAVCNWFFDRKQVVDAVERAKKRYMGQAAGYVRRTARGSIKRLGAARRRPQQLTKRGKETKAWQRWVQEYKHTPPSSPGQPPHTHTGFLKEDIVYTYDPRTESAVIGPWRKPWLNRLHEYGGTIMVDVMYSNGVTWLSPPGSRYRSAKKVGQKIARYPARPFMRPALERSRQYLPKFWLDSVGPY